MKISSKQFCIFSMGIALALALIPGTANAQGRGEDYTLDPNDEVSSRVAVHGYAQAGYVDSANEGEESNTSNTYDIKRAVLMLEAYITPKVFAYFMHEFKSGSVNEYYLEYRHSKAVNFRLGQSKIQYSIENPLSPRTLENISNTVTGNGATSQAVGWLVGGDPLVGNGSGRDMGLMMYGDLLNNNLRYYVEVVNGGRINTNDGNNKKDLIAKLEYKPVKNLRISVSGQKGYGYAYGTSKYNPTIQVGETFKRDRYAAGFEWVSKTKGVDYFRNRCASVRSEVLGGRDGDVNSFGAYITTSIPVSGGMDFVASLDYFNRNTDEGYKKTNIMAGLQYWIHKKCRVQAQYTYGILSDEMQRIEGVTCNNHLLQAQIQFSF